MAQTHQAIFQGEMPGLAHKAQKRTPGVLCCVLATPPHTPSPLEVPRQLVERSLVVTQRHPLPVAMPHLRRTRYGNLALISEEVHRATAGCPYVVFRNDDPITPEDVGVRCRPGTLFGRAPRFCMAQITNRSRCVFSYCHRCGCC